MPNEPKKRENKEPLKIPLDFEETIADMLKVKPTRMDRAPKLKKPKAAEQGGHGKK